MNDLNGDVECIPITECLTSANALKIIGPYDVVLDATDNVATRYLLNDACVLLKKTLVSGSALRCVQLNKSSYITLMTDYINEWLFQI